MNLKKKVLITASALMTSLCLFLIFSSEEVETKVNDIDQTYEEPFEPVVNQTPEPPKESTVTLPIKNENLDLNIQAKFERVVAEGKLTIKQCKENIANIFPMDENEGAKFQVKNLDELKSSIDNYFKNIKTKINVTSNVLASLESLDDSKVSTKQVFETISELGDCGEFQETALFENILEKLGQFPEFKEKKQAVVYSILDQYQDQLKQDVSFIHLGSKLETLEALVDEDYFPEYFTDEIQRVLRSYSEGQRDFMASLQALDKEGKYLGPSEILQISEKEQALLAPVKLQMQELIYQMINSTK
jgi:hypothetical protein